MGKGKEGASGNPRRFGLKAAILFSPLEETEAWKQGAGVGGRRATPSWATTPLEAPGAFRLRETRVQANGALGRRPGLHRSPCLAHHLPPTSPWLLGWEGGKDVLK